jgi:hypothetical protein
VFLKISKCKQNHYNKSYINLVSKMFCENGIKLVKEASTSLLGTLNVKKRFILEKSFK